MQQLIKNPTPLSSVLSPARRVNVFSWCWSCPVPRTSYRHAGFLDGVIWRGFDADEHEFIG